MDISKKINNQKINKLPILRSISKETKNRFDDLLKNALDQNYVAKKQSPEKSPKGEEIRTVRNIDVTKEDATDAEIRKRYIYKENTIKENYILEKFLSDATNLKQEDNACNSTGTSSNNNKSFKKPVPLPRKHKKFSSDESSNNSTNCTYSMTSPRIKSAEFLHEVSTSISTINTYNITKTKDSMNFESTYNTSTSTQPISNIVNEAVNYVSTINNVVVHNNEAAADKTLITIMDKKVKKGKVKKQNKLDVSKLTADEVQKIIDTKYKEIEERKQVEVVSIFKENNSDTKTDFDEDYDNPNVTSSAFSKFNSKSDDFSMSERRNHTYEYLIGVAIYRSDKLVLNNYINHPCVKVHVVDSVTGAYLQRSRNIPVGETLTDLSTAILYPLITKAYNMQAKRSFIPFWDELLIFDEDFDYVMEYPNSVIIFFEILDFLSFSDANARYNTEGSFCGWNKIAWAFLKLIGNGYVNTNQKLRLQLYKPKKNHKSTKECVLHDWWLNNDLVKYPSSIHICVKKVKNNQANTAPFDKTFQNNILNNFKIEEEVDDETLRLLKSDNNANVKKHRYAIRWTRKSSHSCKIPNKILADFQSTDKGCFIVKFSNDGILLACGTATLTKYPIIIYDVPEHVIYCKFQGHHGLIYDLNWSSNDEYLISASSDCTVCVWNVVTRHFFPIQLLPHPSFVYCILFKVLDNTEIMTGCYDNILRIWRADNKLNAGTNYNLIQELEGHRGYITSLCSRKHDQILYSSDSLGVVIEWKFDCERWNMGRIFHFKEFVNTIINKILLHPKIDGLIVFCRDSTIRMIDLKASSIIQWYRGALNERLLLTGCITPCGTYIFSSSEDGSIYIWNTDTGTVQATYNPFMKKSKILTIPYCIDYHPCDHIITICHYGSSVPILLCIYNRSFSGADLQLKSNIGAGEKRKIVKNKSSKIVPPVKSNLSIAGIIDKIDEVIVSAKI